MSPCGYHFSVDDVFESLLETSESGQSVLENEFFSFLKRLHDNFGTDVDLYLFRQQVQAGKQRSLADVSDRLRPWFEDSPWLRFGPHALDDSTPPYTQSPLQQESFCEATYTDIARFAGEGRTSRWVRLHHFSESYELASYFRSREVQALLTTDKPATSYRLPRLETEQLRRHGVVEFAGIGFVRSHVRVENLVGRGMDDAQIDAVLERLCPPTGRFVVFTHEYELARPEVCDMTLRVLSWLNRRDGGDNVARLASRGT